MQQFSIYFSCFLLVITAVGFLWIFVALLRVIPYEKKINKLRDELKEKIEVEKKKPVSVFVMNGRISRLKEEYKPKIEELERKRRFILDKLPFFKK